MALTIDQALQKAVEAHKAGKLQDAESLYRAILQAQPNHPDANHNLGVLAVSVNKSEAALPLFKTALEANPNQGQFWLSYIDALIKEKQFDNARNVLSQAKTLGLVGDKVVKLEARLTANLLAQGSETSANKISIIMQQYKKVSAKKEKKKNSSSNQTNLNKARSPSQVQLNALLEHYQKGRYDLAENLAKEIIQKYPDHPFGWKVIGAVFRQTGRLQESLIAKQRTVALSPDDVDAHSNLGASLQELGRLEDAEASYSKAISIKPDYAQAHNNLGNTLQKLGRLGEAETSYKKAISIKPEYEEAYFNLGNAQRELGRLEEAETSYKKAISIKPDLAEAHGNLGVTLKELGRLEEAEASYKKAISIKPEYIEAHSNLGVTLQQLGRLQEAETSYKKALAINPEFAQAHTNWGVILYERGLWTEAIELHRKAVTLNPASVIFQWYFTLMQIQKVYSIRDDIEKSIYYFGLELTKLDNLITAERLDEAIKAVGVVQPYYIAYLENNNKYLLTKYGEICCRVMSYWQDKHLGLLFNESKELNNTRKIKVGIISSHIRYHSVWNAFLKGIVTQINKKDFDLYIYYLSDQTDNETLVARKSSTKFVIGQKSLYEWYKIIINDDLDIALFPEIGMHRVTLQLASMKLAKSQCTSWGHPETSGLPSIDYYISSDFMETTNSSDNYSESMISLDNIGCYFEPPSLEKEEINLFEFGINLNSNILLCLGAPNKFHPDNDILYIEIIKKISNCQLVFMRDESDAYKIVEQRLNLKFEKNNLSFKNKVVFIPPLSRAGFNTLMNLSRVLLDNIYFSGFNTSIQALGCGLPIVTLKGKFMRSRAASGMLKRIHLDELIANSREMYINNVQRLVNDNVYYQSVKTTIKNNVHFLYKDTTPIRSLENFFKKITLKDC